MRDRHIAFAILNFVIQPSDSHSTTSKTLEMTAFTLPPVLIKLKFILVTQVRENSRARVFRIPTSD